VTNPPFSLFRDFVKQLMDHGKRFSIIGNMNAITYKEIFPLIKSNSVWLGNGFHAGNAFFETPMASDYRDGVYDAKTGLVKFRNCCWFTNIEHGRRHKPIPLMTQAENIRFNKKLKGQKYVTFDNYDAIEVPFTDAIPSDFTGVMGAPISFLDKYSPEQFEIVGLAAGNIRGLSGMVSKTGKDGPYINGNLKYGRVMIRHRLQNENAA